MTKAQRESLVIILREYRYYLSVYKNTVDKLNHELSIVEPTVDPDDDKSWKSIQQRVKMARDCMSRVKHFRKAAADMLIEPGKFDERSAYSMLTTADAGSIDMMIDMLESVCK